MPNMIAKLDEFAALKKGWNSYRADAPSSLAINTANAVLSALAVANLTPSKVSPSAVGGVGITVREGGRRAYVECYNDGVVYRMLSDGITEPDVALVAGFGELSTEIRRYLDA